jgi:hypothetical protein
LGALASHPGWKHWAQIAWRQRTEKARLRLRRCIRKGPGQVLKVKQAVGIAQRQNIILKSLEGYAKFNRMTSA